MSIRNFSKFLQKIILNDPSKMTRQIPFRNFSNKFSNIPEQNTTTGKPEQSIKEPLNQPGSSRAKESLLEQGTNPSRVTGNLTSSYSYPRSYGDEIKMPGEVARKGQGYAGGNTQFTDLGGKIKDVDFDKGTEESGLNNKTDRQIFDDKTTKNVDKNMGQEKESKIFKDQSRSNPQ